MTDPADLLELCRSRSLMLATAESCTGGMLGAALTDVPGSSDVYERGIISYSNAAKMELLGVRAETLETHGAVSEETAREMAAGLLARCPADIALSITGIAGPGGSEHKPEGRVCFGLARTGHPPRSWSVEFGAPGRAQVRAASTAHALDLLWQAASA